MCLALDLPRNKITMHSSRIGGATELFRRGVPTEILGRWLGLTYEIYIRPPPEDCAQQMQRVISDPVVPGRATAVFSFSDPARA